MQLEWQKKPNANLSRSLVATTALLLSGCSLNRLAADAVGDAIAANGGVYTADNDPELIREALPFGLKMIESLLDASPYHQGLLLAASRGFAAYAFILQNDFERSGDGSVNQRIEQLNRVRNLFLRGRDYALRGLEARHSGFVNHVKLDPHMALAVMTKDDVPYLYWAGASWSGAISAVKSDLTLLADLPLAGALMRRVLELDESYDFGSTHEFFIAYEASRPGGSTQRAREHYYRALELSGGRRASVHLTLAESVAVKEQNLAEFRQLLSKTTAVPQTTVREFRLENTVARQRALWLEQHIEDFFIDVPVKKENEG